MPINADFHSIYTLTVFYKNPKNTYPHLYYIPHHSRVSAINSVLGMLNDTYETFEQLFEENKQNFKDFFDFESLNNKVDPGLMIRIFRKQRYLLGSYIVLCCNLEQIIIKEYEHIKKHISEMVTNPPFNDALSLKDRKQEILKYKTYRNKIFAHTAFGDPRGEDDFTLEESLQFFSGASVGTSMAQVDDPKVEHLAIGGISGNLPWCCFPDNPPRPATSLSFGSLKFSELQSDMEQHYSAWFSMYDTAMEIIKNTTGQDIKNKKPEIIGIRRPDQETEKL